MARPDGYWLDRLKRDRRMADRAAEEVQAEVRRAYRSQYLQTARKLDELYAEVQRRGELSRTKLWNYARWREMEAELVEFCEAGRVIQRDRITSALDKVFLETIGADVTKLEGNRYLLPYSPRAVIDTAWSGDHFSNRIWKNTSALAERVQELAQQVVMGDMDPGRVKQLLMHQFDVGYSEAERLVDTEISYVFNKACALNYERLGIGKVTIVNLDVNTCDRCKAIEGEVFELNDAPVIPIHPRCHCSYCVPAEGDEAEVTASGSNLQELYERKGLDEKGRKPKQYSPKGTSGNAGTAIEGNALRAKVNAAIAETKANAEATRAELPSTPLAGPAVPPPAAEPPADSPLPKAPESGTIEAGTWYERNIAGNPEMEARYQEALRKAKEQSGIPGELLAPVIPEDIEEYKYSDEHINVEHGRNITMAEALRFARNAVVMVVRWNGTAVNFISHEGATYTRPQEKRITTAFSVREYKGDVPKLLEVIDDEFTGG